MLKLPKSLIDQARKNKPVYLKAQELTGVPWEAIAAVHYREHSLDPTNPSRVGGPFQFDPPLTERQILFLLKQFTKVPITEYMDYVKKGVNVFETAAVLCACWLRYKSKAVLTPQATEAQIADAFWGYNGRVGKTPLDSAYVANGLDDLHMNMVIRGTVPGKDGKRIWVKTVDKRAGALTVYRQLKNG